MTKTIVPDKTTQTIDSSNRSKSPSGIAYLIVIGVLGASIVLMFFGGAGPELVGVFGLVTVLALIILGVPVAIALVAGGLLGLWSLAGLRSVPALLMEAPFVAASSWSLSVLPMFILMGLVMWRSGISEKIFETARAWVGQLPGGLAAATNLSGAGLAAASGSSLGISYALGRIAIPEMLRVGYKPSISTAVVVVAGTLGQLIPPSVVLVVYAGVAGTPVGPQLIASIIPAVLLALAYTAMILIRSKINPALAPPTGESYSWSARFVSLKHLLPVVVIVVGVLGSMLAGIATATEAGALGALLAIVFTFLRDFKKAPAAIGRAMLDSISAIAAILFLIVGVGILNRMIAMSGITQTIGDFVTSLGLGKVGFLLLLGLIILLLGTVMDPMALILLSVPVLSPVLAEMNVDMIWFGVFLVILAELAVVTPPVGVNAFVVHRLAQDPQVNLGQNVSIRDVFVGALWFVVISLLMAIVLIFVPELALWLPGVSAS